MKFLHLADLHLGKKVNGFSMIEEQKFVLEQILDLVENEGITSVLIAGDIFDRAIPNAFALEMFGDFLYDLNKKDVSTILISGNHDNSDRLSYLAHILQKNNIYISKTFCGVLQQIELDNDTSIYLMPYLYPGLIKEFYPDTEILNYNDAIKAVLDNVNLNENRINILLAHQFVTSSNPLVLSDSEQKSVGGVDEIDVELFKKFDYTALGHLHCPQKVKYYNIRYAGSILKYSFSEINQKKLFTIFEFDKNKKLKLSFKEIKFIRELREYRGYIKDFLDEKFYSTINKDDYIHFILLDDNILDAKKILSSIYPNIMILEFDNKYTRDILNSACENFSKDKTMLEHFCDFYKMQMNAEIEPDRRKIVEDTINSIKEVN